MTYRGVIFDLFHTLTGLESEWSDLPLTSDLLKIDRRAWDQIVTMKSRRRLTGEQRVPYLIVREMAHEIDPTISDERIRAAAEIRVRRFQHALQRIPAANVEMLKRLRAAGLRLGLVSNADAMEVATWKDCPLAGLFDSEVFSCEVGLVKPEPAIYRKCLDELALRASECMFVGDGGSNELIGAKEVGLTTVFVSGVIAELWPERIPPRIEMSDHHIDWASQLPELLGM
jgi:putative hydrolase of the HAD superfamily